MRPALTMLCDGFVITLAYLVPVLILMRLLGPR
jgi:hypothetical protein